MSLTPSQPAGASAGKLALVFCVHHKPWLIMSTLLTVLLQDVADADLYFVYHTGDGTCDHKPSYDRYLKLAAQFGLDPQLSPYDPRVRRVCQIKGRAVFELEFENDTTLDSGAWYKFIRTGLWRRYEHVCFFGEGTLLTSSHVLSSLLTFAQRHDAHFVASGHEKRRIPRREMLYAHRRNPGANAMHAFHDEMTHECFAVFCRDPEFRAVFDGWKDEDVAETQNHVPYIWPRNPMLYRLEVVANARHAAPDGGLRGKAKNLVAGARPWWLAVDTAVSRASVALANLRTTNGAAHQSRSNGFVHVNGRLRRLDEIAATVDYSGVRFHKVDEPEWYGCTVAHVFSRTFLERFSDRLEQYRMYDVLEIPYAATALEVIWGFLPRWLGFDKWFTDGIHRVRKHFVTYRREDEPDTMAMYLNRYHRGRICVASQGDYVTLRAAHKSLAGLPAQLPGEYLAN